MWFYFIAHSELSCLAKPAKSYPVFGPTYMPQIPNLLHHITCTSSAYHCLLRETDVSFHIKTICLVYKRLMRCIYVYRVHLQHLFATYALNWKETFRTWFHLVAWCPSPLNYLVIQLLFVGKPLCFSSK